MKNTGVKIRPIYKALALGTLLGITGCKKAEYKNVVFGLEKQTCQTVVFIRDVETGVERIYRNYDSVDQNCRYLRVGDTVSFLTDNPEYYRKNRMFNSKHGHIVYDMDSIGIRRGRAINTLVNQQFGKQK